MNPWSSLPPNMTTAARGFCSCITSRVCLNQLKTSGRSSPLAMRPSISPTGSMTGLEPIRRRSDWPGTTTSESPAIQRRSWRLGENFSRRGGGGGSAGSSAVAAARARRRRCRSRRPPSGRARPSARVAAGRGRARSLTDSSGSVTASARSRFHPSGWIVADLCRPGRVEEGADQQGERGDGDGRACRVHPATALADPAARAASSLGCGRVVHLRTGSR